MFGVNCDVLSAKALEYLSDVTEELRFGFAVYEYIADVYFAYSVNKSVEDLVLYTALKVRASSFQSHNIATRVHCYRPPAALKAVSTRDAGSRGV